MRYKILIADDDENIRIALQHVFSDHHILSAGDGETAVGIVIAERPALVLLDINMPRMNGLEVLLALKNIQEKPLFIMLTGNDELLTACKALESGAASYITKPFEADVIRKLVLSALEEKENLGKDGSKPWRAKKD